MTKKLYRSRKNYMIAGVCGGIAEYFDIDPTIVRLVAILIVLLGGIGVIAYILAWIIIPQNPEQESEADITFNHREKNTFTEQENLESNRSRQIWGGLILIFLGLFLLLKNFFPWFIWMNLWPVVLIIIGLVLMIRSFSKKKE